MEGVFQTSFKHNHRHTKGHTLVTQVWVRKIHHCSRNPPRFQNTESGNAGGCDEIRPKCSNPWIEKEFFGWLVRFELPGILGGHQKIDKLGDHLYRIKRNRNEFTNYWVISLLSFHWKVYDKCLENMRWNII